MDASTNATVASDRPSRRRNWWKIGFFVALFAFEFTREMLVVNDAAGAMPNSYAQVWGSDGYAIAKGSWKRMDGGDRLVPGTVTIECRQDLGQCVEASTMIYNDSVFSPELDWFPATFTEDAVTYENDIPACAKYSVRLDLKLKKAFAVREKKEKVTNPNCGALESRVEMQITDGYETHKERDPLEGHFVPILQLLMPLFK